MNQTKALLLVATALVCAEHALANATATAETRAHGAQTTTASSDTSGNSSENYLDDRMVWDHSIPAWSHDALMNNSGPDYCLPRSTAVIGQSSSLLTVSTSDQSASADAQAQNNTDGSKNADVSNNTNTSGKPKSGGKSTPTAAKKYLSVIVDPNRTFADLFGYDNLDDAKKKIDAANTANVELCQGVKPQAPFVDGQEIYVDPTDALRWGWEYGVLAVPFKMQLGGKNSFSGAASIGPYLGYKIPLWDSGIAFSPVIFAGASAISVPDSSGGNKNTQTMAGLSYGVGLIGHVKDGFQFGVIFGKDHVDSNNYQYNDKTWISFAIGYSFAQ